MLTNPFCPLENKKFTPRDIIHDAGKEKREETNNNKTEKLNARDRYRHLESVLEAECLR
jgi:hypothetical protein